MIGPAKLPPEVVSALSKEISNMLKNPEFLGRLRKSGVEPVLTTPAEFAKEIQDEYKLWGEVIAKAGISRK